MARFLASAIFSILVCLVGGDKFQELVRFTHYRSHCNRGRTSCPGPVDEIRCNHSWPWTRNHHSPKPTCETKRVANFTYSPETGFYDLVKYSVSKIPAFRLVSDLQCRNPSQFVYIKSIVYQSPKNDKEHLCQPRELDEKLCEQITLDTCRAYSCNNTKVTGVETCDIQFSGVTSSMRNYCKTSPTPGLCSGYKLLRKLIPHYNLCTGGAYTCRAQDFNRCYAVAAQITYTCQGEMFKI